MEEMGNKYSRESGVTNVFGLGKRTHKVHFAARFWRCQFLRGSCSCVCSGGTRIRNETRIKAAKLRLSKQGLSIPRSELLFDHMAVNLLTTSMMR